MATNLDLDNDLIDEAVRVGGHSTRKAAVTEALKEYVRRRKQPDVLNLFGTIDYETEYDYKAQRARS